MAETTTVPASGTPGPDQPERLAKTLKPSWVWAIALGSAVGWGAFILPTDWIAAAGPAGAITGFLIGGGLMVLIAVSYGFLIRSFPVSGGEMAFALVGFGRTHAFFCGWFLTLGYTSIVALNASALALLFRKLLPGVVQQGYLYSIAGWDVYLVEVIISITALAVFAYLNIHGTAISGRVQFIACVIMLVAVGCILAGVLLHPDSSLSFAAPPFPDGVSPLAAIVAIVAIAPWAYIGFDNVPQAAEEFDFPPSKAMRLIVLALLAAALLYAAMIGAVAVAEPWQALVSGESAWGTADAITGLLGGVGMLLLTIGITMGVSTGLNGFYVSASRILLGMGRAQMVPQVFARLHPKHKTPYVGILFVGAFCLVTPWFGRAALEWVVNMSAVGVTVAYLYTCLCAFKLFRTTGSAPRPGDLEGTRSTTKKVLSLVGALISVTFMALLLVPGSPAVLGPQSMIALVIWVVIGVVFFLMRRKHNKTLTDEQVDLLVLGAPRPQSFGARATPAKSAGTIGA
ncbi:amino acid transporter [Arthrobacter crystallopoietes BAB-32]|uniref:Amino acid transporter n=1 Tax=Arthrobacter crystallopoietes BAB-32 TaxID=1246476 RepID=N1V2E4_9MICC|nr:APC family permease [Arthrobacter crystallopoietes]EMY34237.1 amino acid transporter [Arthrobacter crystallopoietes BAB-32]